MAPRTRLQAQPDRRVQYINTGRRIATVVRAPAGSSTKSRAATHITAQKTAGGKKPETITGAVKKRPQPNRKARLASKECVLCSETEANFKLPTDVSLCKHFMDTCTECVGNLLKSKITERQFQEPGLACPFPECNVVIAFQNIKEMVSDGAFEAWDNALLRHEVVTSKNFISCLNTSCGRHFSIEGIKDDCKRKAKFACPYCNHFMCLRCDRPWHVGKGCEKTKEQEIAASELKIKTLGCKPCPTCGAQINKNGGCDHIQCTRCKTHFCWKCMAVYSANTQHGEDCPYNARLADAVQGVPLRLMVALGPVFRLPLNHDQENQENVPPVGGPMMQALFQGIRNAIFGPGPG